MPGKTLPLFEVDMVEYLKMTPVENLDKNGSLRSVDWLGPCDDYRENSFDDGSLSTGKTGYFGSTGTPVVSLTGKVDAST